MKILSKKNIFLLLISFLIIYNPQTALSIEIEGINIPDTIKTTKDTLILNGAGIRTKFFFNIYIGALYVKSKQSDINKIVNNPQEKRITLNFLYKEVSKEKLINGWTDGFQNNNDDSVFEKLKTRLDKFNSFFITLHKGDTVQLDFLETKNTKVTINSRLKGEITGSDFQVALLKVWLGDDPADYNLKEAMLGISEY